MANFKTHKNIGVLSSIISTVYVYSGLSNIDLYINVSKLDTELNFLTLFLMVLFGIVGSLMPDIDLKTSKPSQIFRILIYMTINIFMINFIILFKDEIILSTGVDWYLLGILTMIVSFISSFTFIKYFEHNLKHRGIVHSIPFAILLSIILFEILDIFKINFDTYIDINNFSISLIFFIGFIVHLTLDEIYSIDFSGKRLKKSFGTALKLIDKNNKYGTLIIWTLIIIYFKDLLIILLI